MHTRWDMFCISSLDASIKGRMRHVGLMELLLAACSSNSAFICNIRCLSTSTCALIASAVSAIAMRSCGNTPQRTVPWGSWIWIANNVWAVSWLLSEKPSREKTWNRNSWCFECWHRTDGYLTIPHTRHESMVQKRWYLSVPLSLSLSLSLSLFLSLWRKFGFYTPMSLKVRRIVNPS